MKKTMRIQAMAAFLLGTAVFGFAACGGNDHTASDSLSEGSADSAVSSSAEASSAETIDPAVYDLTGFELAKYTSPVWEGSVSYAEGTFVMENAEGIVEPLRLLYPAERIISVRSADLSMKYEEGKDYELTGEGELRILPDGSIPVLAYDEYYFENYTDDGLQTQIPAAAETGAYIVAETTKDSPGMSRWCLAVTYLHSDEGPVEEPADKSGRFPRLRKKLEAGEAIKAVYYGDSITYGWASTALEEVNRPPYCPMYADLAMDYLEAKYGSEIARVNLSRSGETSAWAAEYANYSRVCAENPDLVVLAFGMNDGVVTEARQFVANIRNIVRNIQSRCPETEIVVVTSMLPNDLVGYQQGTSLRNFHESYPEALAEAEEDWEGVAVADVTAVHTQMLTRKKFQDTTSSNTNHPNDYMHRVYAQVVLRTLLGDGFEAL